VLYRLTACTSFAMMTGKHMEDRAVDAMQVMARHFNKSMTP
jgi:hypothetical protein